MRARKEGEKLPLLTKLFYGMGDIYGGGAFNIVNFYYAVFLTDVVKINPSYSAVIFLISKIWDAVTDPFMGYLSDRTNSRWGRRRPYFLLGIPLIFISFVMLWFPVNYESEMSRFIYILLAYMFFNTVFTVVMVPYQAMSAELSSDYEERTNLNAIRLVCSLVSSLLCALFPLFLINGFGDDVEGIRKGYIAMSLVFGLFFALPWLGTFLFTSETHEEKKREYRKGWFKAMFAPLRIRAFRKYMGLQLFTFIAFDIIVLVIGHYMKYWMKDYGAMDILLGLLIIFQVIAVPLYTKISHWKGKEAAYMMGAAIWGVASLGLFFIRPETPLAALYGIGIVVGIGMSGAIVTLYTMFGDVVDVGDLAFGENRSGSFSGMLTFLRKTSTALAQSLVLAMLGWIGYREPVDIMQNGVLISMEQEQPEAVLLVIRLLITLVPILLLGFGFRIARSYPLKKKIQEEIRTILDKREEGEAKEIDPREEELVELLV
ncbi:MAG: MFS transporter [Spirochaetales bacterium]|nr:MFS transporter [Spirochaetales bacterium]